MNQLPKNVAVSIVARSPGLDAAQIEVAVTLPTFRRPDHLLKTLASLRAQRTERRFAVIVMENDDEVREGAQAAASLFESGELAGMLIVAHERGNCSAYNAGWSTAVLAFPDLRWLLVIDDDEIATPDWIETMCTTAERLGADIVGGPQKPIFSDPVRQKWENHPVFRAPYGQTGLVPALYSSGNLLVGREVLAAMPQPYLDTRFNFLGGGDSDFLSRASAAGFALGWCADAPVLETVPDRRTESDWIRARSLRNGVISTLVEQRKRAGSSMASLRVIAHSLALLAAAPLRGMARGLATGSLAEAAYPVHVAIGRTLAHFGYVNEQYRQPEKN